MELKQIESGRTTDHESADFDFRRLGVLVLARCFVGAPGRRCAGASGAKMKARRNVGANERGPEE
jgi:hypothetical protein